MTQRAWRADLAPVLQSFRREFALVAACSAVANLLMLTPTIYMLQIYDRVLVSNSEMTLLGVSLVCLILFGVVAVSERVRSRLLVRAGVRLDRALGTRVFNASFDASLAAAGHRPARAFIDLMQVRQFLTGQGIFAFMDVPWAPVYIAVMFFMHPVLGWMAVLFAGVQLALAWFGQRRTARPAEDAVRAGTDAAVDLQGKLRNAEVLEAMGMVDSLRARWDVRHRGALAAASASDSLGGRVAAWSKFVRYSQQSLSLAAAAVLVIDGQLSPGAMIAANVLMTRALTPIDQLVGTWRPFLTARAAFERLRALLRDGPQRDPAPARPAPQGGVTLHHVFAHAPSRPRPILDDICLCVPAGTVVAVAGPSGAGKSTLARVLMGIWPAVEGDVLMDDLPLASWDRGELGPHVGYLPQDVELFPGTIAENIARLAEVDHAKVIEAAQRTGLHEAIVRLPAGYDTQVGEGGGLLSGGQRQRVALARAVYGNPKLVVLDEPNANLDDAGDAALLACIAQLKARGTTVFLVTQRAHAASAADWLLLLDQGRVAAWGPRQSFTAIAHNGPGRARSTTTTALPA